MEMRRYQMKYKIEKTKSYNVQLKILDKIFVKNNRNKGKIIIENKKYYLKEFIQLNNFKKSELKIDILFNENISNISYMFNNSKSLKEFSMKNNIENKEIDYDYFEIEEINNELEYNINKIKEDKGTLYEGLIDNIINSKLTEISKKESLETKSIYSRLDILQIKNKSEEMICENKIQLLSSFYDKLNFNNIIDMSFMFYNCESLVSLPDLSKWNNNIVNNVNDISYMFSDCRSLSSLPDLSKWNINNVINISYMFKNCISLSSLPDISKWNTNNVNDMTSMFYNCESLLSLPDISNRCLIYLNGILIMLLI